VTTVGTLIHKAYCYPHLAAERHTTTGSGVFFKFPEFLGSTNEVKGTEEMTPFGVVGRRVLKFRVILFVHAIKEYR
jgi:hypothetical protein